MYYRNEMWYIYLSPMGRIICYIVAVEAPNRGDRRHTQMMGVIPYSTVITRGEFERYIPQDTNDNLDLYWVISCRRHNWARHRSVLLTKILSKYVL